MSVFEPDLRSEPSTGSDLPAPLHPPAFSVVRRGYDRAQVDTHIAELAAHLEAASDQLAATERARAEMEREVKAVRHQAPPSFEQLGTEAAAVLEQAGSEAAKVLGQAGRSAELLVEQAQGHAEAIVKDAEAQAGELVKAAEQQAGQFDATARDRLSMVQAETEQVGEFRRGMLHHLGRLRGDIDALLDKAAKVDVQLDGPAERHRASRKAVAPVVEQPSAPAVAAEGVEAAASVESAQLEPPASTERPNGAAPK